MEKYYAIAGLTVKMDSFGRTEEQAEAYRCKLATKVDIQVDSEPLKERYREARPGISEDTVEYMCSAGSFYKQLLDFDGFMLHSSAVVVDGRAYLFAADSGTGKSTHTQLWLEKFGEGAYILNDDKPALRREADGWYAYGTPWSGKFDISVNTRVPVAGIAVLERGENNRIRRISGIQAVSGVLRQAHRPREAERREKLLAILDKLITEVPIWKLKCNRELEAATVAYEAMAGKEK